jgi:hypothetical protein
VTSTPAAYAKLRHRRIAPVGSAAPPRGRRRRRGG